MWNPQGIYNQYLLRTPAMLAGSGSARGLYNYPCARVAVIHGCAWKDQLLFRETFRKKDIRFFKRSWKGEPDLEGLSDTLHELEAFRPDTIIAVGGGSVIDGAKLCRLFLEIPYYKPGETRTDGKIFTTKLIAVPTTVGSGTEVSSAAVYMDKENNCKQMIVMHELQPDVIVYDSGYVRNTPDRLLCASALDAFAHILEGYVSGVENVIVETIAEEGLTVLTHELNKLVRGQKGDMDFYRLLYAGQLGGIVQNHCIVGAAHAAAHQLAGYGFSHGEAVALLLPAVIRLNAEKPETEAKYDRIAERAGFESTDALADFVRLVCRKGDIESRRRKLRETMKTHAADEAFRNNIKNDRGGRGNPAMIDDAYIARLADTV